MHIELLLEEPSAEAFFAGFLTKIVADGTTWRLIPFQGKADLLSNMEKRLKGYASWIPDDWRIVVLVDEDRQDCRKLKSKLEAAAAAAGLLTKTKAGKASFVVLNRIAVEDTGGVVPWGRGGPSCCLSWRLPESGESGELP